MLLGKYDRGSKKAIAFASRLLLPSERKCSPEAFTIKFAVNNFHRFIQGRLFRLQTDHRHLLSIYGPKEKEYQHTQQIDYSIGSLRY